MSNLSDALARLVAMEKDAISGCDAVPYYVHWQSQFPYWTNRIGAGQYSWNSEDINIVDRLLIARLVIGHFTENYEGVSETNLATYMEDFMEQLAANPGMTATGYAEEPDYLMPGHQIEIVSDTGLQFFQVGGSPTLQVGTEFTLRVRIIEDAM